MIHQQTPFYFNKEKGYIIMSNKIVLRAFKKNNKVVYQVIYNNKIISQSTKFNNLNLKAFGYKLK